MKLFKLTHRQIVRRIVILGALAALVIPGLNNRLKVVEYEIDSGKIKNPFRIALISDLHSCRYGEHEEELINALDGLHPDIVCLTGDMFDENSNNENTIDFLEGISGRYPVYYVTGNHEFWGGVDKYENDMAVIERLGIRRLQGELYPVDINGNYVTVAGVDDFDSHLVDGDLILENQFLDCYLNLDADSYNILLSHRPEYYDTYTAHDYDLVLCGHTHGGQWRIPGIINGLYSPDQGLFPKYAGGMYEDPPTTMIVSRGLARESTPVPRFYNPPELVIIDINPIK